MSRSLDQVIHPGEQAGAVLPSPPMTPHKSPESVTSQYVMEHIIQREPSRSRSKSRKASVVKAPASPAPHAPSPAKRRIALKELLPRVIVTPELAAEDEIRFGQIQSLALNIFRDHCSYDQEALGRFLAQPVSLDRLREFSDQILLAYASMSSHHIRLHPNALAIQVIDMSNCTESELSTFSAFDLCNAACCTCFAWTKLHPERWLFHLKASVDKATEVGSFSTADTAVLPPPLDLTNEVAKRRNLPTWYGGIVDVYEGQTRTNLPVALYFVRSASEKTNDIRKRIRGSLKIWQRLHHPYLVPFYGVSQDGDDFYIVSPWLSFTTILDRLREPEATVLHSYRYLKQVARGLQYLHSFRPPVVHGGVRCANVLISDQGDALLTEFGLAKILDDICGESPLGGSIRYLAPELFDTAGPHTHKTTKSDVYAFGCLVFEVFSGQPPYAEVPEQQVPFALFNGYALQRPEQPVARGFTDDLWGLCQRCCDFNLAKRPSMTQVAITLTRLCDVASSARA